MVPWEGNRAALKAMAEVFRTAALFRMARHGLHLAIGPAHPGKLRGMGRRAALLHVPGIRVTDPKAAQCGEVLKGVLKPAQCKLFGKECTPENPVGALMVSSEGSCAATIITSIGRPASPTSAAAFESMTMNRCLPKSDSAIRKSRWPMAPEAKPAADWWKDCSRRFCWASTANRWAMPRIWTFGGTRIAITADSFVVKPLRFPGGSIGELAVNGTVNDLAVSGARAQALVVTYVLESGLPTEILEAEVRAMAKAAARAGVRIAGGDTKVVEHGKADGMYITTAGIGRPIAGVRPLARVGASRR